MCPKHLDKMKNKKYHKVITIPKSKWKIFEKCKIDTPKHT